LNLAQSVAVVLYELRKEWLKRHEPQKAFGLEPPLDFEHQEILFQHLKEALTSIRFLWDFRSDGIFHVIRQVLARAMPTQKEAAVFHGLAKQLDFIARNYGIVHPRDGRPPSMKRPAKPSPPTESAQPEVPFEQFPTAELHEQFPAAPAGDRAVSVPEKPLDPA
jgi:hypothetical protein